MFAANNKKSHNSDNNDNNRNNPVKFPPARLATVFPALLAGLFLILPANNAWAKPVSIGGAVLGELQWKMCRAEMTTERVTPLMKAAKEGNAEKVRELLAAGADKTARVNGRELRALFPSAPLHSEQGYTLLMLAFMPPSGLFQDKEYTPRPEVIKTLIEAGVDVRAANIRGETALYFAALNGDTEAVQMLLAAGADVDAQDNYYKETPLKRAAGRGHTEVVRALIAAGADVNARDNDNSTALMSAVFGRKAEIVQMLIAAGADVNAKDDKNETALWWAAHEGHIEIAKALIAAGADVNAKDNDNETAMDVAKNNEIKELLKAAGAK